MPDLQSDFILKIPNRGDKFFIRSLGALKHRSYLDSQKEKSMEGCLVFSCNVHYRTKINKVLQNGCKFVKNRTNIISEIFKSPLGSIIVIDIDSSDLYAQLLPALFNEKNKRIIFLCSAKMMNGSILLKIGNCIHLRKPFSESEFSSALSYGFVEELNSSYTINENFIGISDNAIQVREQARDYAASGKPIFICGETGTGKEIISHYITGGDENAVYVDCGLLNSTLSESAIFGAKKGSFTGADHDIIGYVEHADGKYLVLDEIENLSPITQAQLLRFLQDGTYRKIGDYSYIPSHSNCKIITISNKSPLTLIDEGKLREDLYHRISSQIIYIKPLRERKEDIPLLIKYWEDKQNYERHIDNYNFFFESQWRGNARQLFSVVDYIHYISKDKDYFIYELPEYFFL